MLQTKNTLLGKARVYILVFFSYYLLMINSLSENNTQTENYACLLYTSPSPRDATLSRMPSSA